MKWDCLDAFSVSATLRGTPLWCTLSRNFPQRAFLFPLHTNRLILSLSFFYRLFLSPRFHAVSLPSPLHLVVRHFFFATVAFRVFSAAFLSVDRCVTLEKGYWRPARSLARACVAGLVRLSTDNTAAFDSRREKTREEFKPHATKPIPSATEHFCFIKSGECVSTWMDDRFSGVLSLLVEAPFSFDSVFDQRYWDVCSEV